MEAQAQAFSRRTVLAGATASLLAPGFARADGACPTQAFYQPMGEAICNAFIDPKGLQIAAQSSSEWCWAVSTSNLFAYYGHTVTQQTIVEAGIGTLANQPATVQVIQSVLNRTWTDAAGGSFKSTAQILYSVDEKLTVPSNLDIINDLQANRPLLFCNMSHAMMLVSLNYVPPSNRPKNIAAAIVIDPWPGIGLRALTPAELTPANQPGGQLRLLMQVEVA